MGFRLTEIENECAFSSVNFIDEAKTQLEQQKKKSFKRVGFPVKKGYHKLLKTVLFEPLFQKKKNKNSNFKRILESGCMLIQF